MTVELIDADQHAEALRIPEVLKRLKQTQVDAETQPLGLRDGLACFNHLYSVITGQVQEDYLDGKFASGDFITRLDVAFANRYLSAVDAVVVIARYVAWQKAKRLWAKRLDGGADAAVERSTARSVGSFNRGLLELDRSVRHAFSALLLRGGRS